MDGYDVAQVCLNGHATNGHARTMPEFNNAHCPDCGEFTIMDCPNCTSSIQGKYNSSGVIDTLPYQPPRYCHSCGAPFPWVSRAIQAADKLAQIELDDADKENFEQTISELTKNSPQTTVAVARIKKIITKAGGTFGDSLRNILVDVVSETVRKAIWGH